MYLIVVFYVIYCGVIQIKILLNGVKIIEVSHIHLDHGWSPNFLKKHDLDLIARAHQVVEDGYEFFAKRTLVTVFSAPNYCGEFDNAGAMMSVDENLMCSFQILKPAETKRSYFEP